MLGEPVLVDTGALIALYNASDPRHRECSALVKTLPVGKAYTCWPVVVEASYLLRAFPRERVRLFDAIAADEFVLLPLGRGDLPAIHAIMDKYDDQEIDLADAALVHLANREGIGSVFTLDARHFHVLRNAAGLPFRVLPE
jgi:predicted nucleic acid-binding protein